MMVTIYPNPSNGLFTISTLTLNSKPIVYLVSDVTGKIIKQGEFNSGSHILDLEKIASGVYVLNLSNAEVNQTVKLIKQ
ncbi:MAG: T9SS type A sorting domain-containing protein [Bacteroidetes bacterium]|nr:T9SS type A sorting domain-containing protein [Bacteroidota bacterium]